MPNFGPAETVSDLADKCSVMVAYEDSLTHDRARAVFERLLHQFWGEVDFEISWWSFDFLRDAAMARLAAMTAASAELIIFSVRTSNGLPLTVRHWIKGWLKLRGTREGALALLQETVDPEPTAPALAYFRWIAEQAHLDFYCQGRPEPVTSRLFGARLDVIPNGRVTAALVRILDPRVPPSRWGINE